MKQLEPNFYGEKKGVRVFVVNEETFNTIKDTYLKEAGAQRVFHLTYGGELYELAYEKGTIGIRQSKRFGKTLDIKLTHESKVIKCIVSNNNDA